MVTSDLGAEVEIWPFRACAVHPAIIIGTVQSFWTWLYMELPDTTFHRTFLANVDSSSCSLYVIVRPSVVCLSSVTFVRPTQTIETFGNFSTP